MGHVRDEEILLRAFGGLSGVRDSWSVVTCLYEGAFCRAAFAAMADVRMGYMEDAYEFFVLASRASRLENAPDLIAFTYYLGAGRSGYGFMALDVFCSRQREVHALVREVAAFAEADGRETLRFCAEWFERECLRTLSNEWTVRLQPADQVAAVPALAETWGIASTCTMLASPLMGGARRGCCRTMRASAISCSMHGAPNGIAWQQRLHCRMSRSLPILLLRSRRSMLAWRCGMPPPGSMLSEKRSWCGLRRRVHGDGICASPTLSFRMAAGGGVCSPPPIAS